MTTKASKALKNHSGLYFVYLSIIFKNPSFSVFCKKIEKTYFQFRGALAQKRLKCISRKKNPNPRPQEYVDVSLLLLNLVCKNFTPLHLKQDLRRLWTNSTREGLLSRFKLLPSHSRHTVFRAMNLLKYSCARREWSKTEAPLPPPYPWHQHMQRHEEYTAQITEYSNAASRCHTSNKASQAKASSVFISNTARGAG